MKKKGWILPAALIGGALWLMSAQQANATLAPSAGTGGNIAVNPNAPPGQDPIARTAKAIKDQVTQIGNYKITGSTSTGEAVSFGNFTGQEIQTLAAGKPVVQGLTTTKIENIMTTLVKGSAKSSGSVSWAGQNFPLTNTQQNSQQLIQVTPVNVQAPSSTYKGVYGKVTMFDVTRGLAPLSALGK
jgi:hypothetical protein